MIPKIFFQTNHTKLDTYVINMIKYRLSSEWKYEFYSDDDVIQYFVDNPINDLPDIIKKYNSITTGAHKADLFRYYYLYINGGVFMDSDAMIYVDIDTIIQNYDFISVYSITPGTIFQGILGASPKNEIIKKALYHAYDTNPNILDNNYFYLCKELYNIIKDNNFGYNIKIYEEKLDERLINDSHYCANTFDGNKLLFKHYFKYKIIPIIHY